MLWVVWFVGCRFGIDSGASGHASTFLSTTRLGYVCLEVLLQISRLAMTLARHVVQFGVSRVACLSNDLAEMELSTSG